MTVRLTACKISALRLQIMKARMGAFYFQRVRWNAFERWQPRAASTHSSPPMIYAAPSEARNSYAHFIRCAHVPVAETPECVKRYTCTCQAAGQLMTIGKITKSTMCYLMTQQSSADLPTIQGVKTQQHNYAIEDFFLSKHEETCNTGWSCHIIIVNGTPQL